MRQQGSQQPQTAMGTACKAALLGTQALAHSCIMTTMTTMSIEWADQPPQRI